MSSPRLRFLGGAGTVTGSRFLIETEHSRVLIDAGLFQGLKQHRLQNWEPFPVTPSSIDAVVLTHAHIDHSGYLPALARSGFAGPVWCTRRTRDLCNILLPDAGHLQEEEARYANKRGYSKHAPALPLFTAADARAVESLFRTVEFGERRQVADDVSVAFQPAGHILGSASVLVEIGHGPDQTRLLVSGDLGRGDHPVLCDPMPPPAADVVLLESTYGDRLHADSDKEIDNLVAAINESAGSGGMILIPAFAVDRTEVVLLLLRELMEAGRIPKLAVYADSPMALRVLDVYRRAAAEGDVDVRSSSHSAPFTPGGGLHECHTPDESRSLSELTFPSIIISASGMATGGRVLHHLKRLLPDRRNTVVLSGFQAAGTRGRKLADGAEVVKMLGQYVPVRATIVAMESFSVHADADELTGWTAQMSTMPEVVYLVHGETSASEALSKRLTRELGIMAVVPAPLEQVSL